VGTYSSIAIASSLVILMSQYLANREKHYKAKGSAQRRRVVMIRPEPKA
jgi:hypothetical protein